MNNELKNRIKSNKKTFENFSYLSILEIFILLAPLIAYPYLVRVLGMELYGWVITGQVTASYCTVLIDFGFKRISARHIALNLDNKDKIGEVISAILTIRFLLWIFSFIIYFCVVWFVKSYHAHLTLFIFSFLTTLSSVVFVDFYFQGTENMKYITIVNIIVRGLFVGATFIVIKKPSDYIYVPLLWSIGYIIGGAISLWIVFIRHLITFKIPNPSILKKHLKEGSIIFTSDAMLTIKDKLNYNVMGAFIGMSDIVIYDVGSKVSNLLLKPINILITVLFPRMSKKPSVSTARKVMRLIFFTALFLVVITNLFLPYIIEFFLGEIVDLTPIRIFTLIPLILGISVYISTNVFFAFGFDKYILKSTYITTIGYVLILCIFYFSGFLNNILAFVILTLTAYLIELLYRLFLTHKIFDKVSVSH